MTEYQSRRPGPGRPRPALGNPPQAAQSRPVDPAQRNAASKSARPADQAAEPTVAIRVPAQPSHGAATNEPISPRAQPDVEPRRPSFVSYPLPVSTTEQLPGAEIHTVLGVVIGVSTRPRDMAHHPEMAYFNAVARQDAIGSLVLQAQEIGADAVVGLRFDEGKISDTVSEVTAYGTAVRVRPSN